MSTDCRYCGGTGKARRIAVVGDPLPQDHMGAQHKIQDAVRPADHVVAFSDFAQMVSAGANHTHARERDKKLEDAGDFDEVIDISPSKEAKARDAAEAAKVVQTPGPGNPPPPEGMTPGASGGGPSPHVPPSEDEHKAPRKSLFGKKSGE